MVGLDGRSGWVWVGGWVCVVPLECKCVSGTTWKVAGEQEAGRSSWRGRTAAPSCWTLAPTDRDFGHFGAIYRHPDKFVGCPKAEGGSDCKISPGHQCSCCAGHARRSWPPRRRRQLWTCPPCSCCSTYVALLALLMVAGLTNTELMVIHSLPARMQHCDHHFGSHNW